MSKVYELVWSYFVNDFNEDEDEHLIGFTKSAEALNREIKEKFRYDPQLQIKEVGSSYDTSYDQSFHVIVFIDENGKLHLSKWTEKS